jgi:hypothetical protein
MTHLEQFREAWEVLKRSEGEEFEGTINRLYDLIHYSDVRQRPDVFQETLDEIVDLVHRFHPKGPALSGLTRLAIELAEASAQCPDKLIQVVEKWEKYPESVSFCLSLVVWGGNRKIIQAMLAKDSFLNDDSRNYLNGLLNR